MNSYIEPNAFVAVRLPSEQLKVVQISPNTDISLGKYGCVPVNQIIGRPFYLTFEIINSEGQLRVVPAAEIHGDALVQQEGDASVSAEEDEPQSQSNQRILDDPSNQRLTFEEIEGLKSNSNGNSIIQRILESHVTIHEKTAFSLAKYTLRKNRKYLKRFSILPLDISTLTDWLSKERSGNHLELRNETLAMAMCFANVYKIPNPLPGSGPSRKYLVVDDTGGLMVAAMAERMEILKPYATEEASRDGASITLVHSNTQPNLALLRYFDFDYNFPSPKHPLSAHLKTLSWQQLLSPESDQTCIQPDVVAPEVLATWKSTRRGNYFRKHRRFSETLSIVNATRDGGFQALVVSSHMSAISILKNLVPLLTGGAQVVVFSPNIEPLADLADAYSTERRTAFLNATEQERTTFETFPVDPTQLLGVSIQTTNAQNWQILDSRSHPSMTSLGGAEGYIFSGTRVSPLAGKTQARGTTGKKRKVA